jgi:hypothetical protein
MVINRKLAVFATGLIVAAGLSSTVVPTYVADSGWDCPGSKCPTVVNAMNGADTGHVVLLSRQAEL